MAAAERGVQMLVQPFPEGEAQAGLDQRPVAQLRFVENAAVEKDPLFASILSRRTNRAIYDPSRPLSKELAKQIAEGRQSVDPKLIDAVKAITVAAITVEITTPHTYRESVDLMRIGAEEVDSNPDGLVLSGTKIEALKMIGVLDRAALADPSSSAFKTGLEIQQEICVSVPSLFWIVTPSNSRIDQLEAGRQYVRANLRATAQGVAMHPLSQALQEYPEMATEFSRIREVLGVPNGQTLQMLARMGFAPPTEPSPRWPLETHFRP